MKRTGASSSRVWGSIILADADIDESDRIVTFCRFIGASFKTSHFGRSLRWAQISILEILHVFLRLKFSPALTSAKLKRFEIGSLVLYFCRHRRESQMSLFSKLRTPSPAQSPQAADLPMDNELQGLYLDTIHNLLLFLKDSALDIHEIGSEHFKSVLNDIKIKYNEEVKAKKLELYFKKQSEGIGDYLQRQKAYLGDREKELRDIIDLLSKAMTGLGSDNQTFYRRVFDHSEKLEQITLLDDIKKIKNALKTEVEQIKETVQTQKKQERLKIEKLAIQVDSLKGELEKTQVQLQTDALTGINNRKALDSYLEDRVERCNLQGASFAVLMLDIDDFKSINDTYGHLIGDRVLLAFATKCKSSIRADDFIARYGGEEFIILLPGASLRNAKKKAKQICKLLAAAQYADDSAGPGHFLSATVSIGVSTLQIGDTPATVIERADKALYFAKKSGKNRVATEKDI
jgi:diguanylate cyclase